MSNQSIELYKKHRPKLLKDLRGQDAAVKVINGFIKNNAIPHFFLIVGPSGCGKTTIARILQKKVGCGDSDFCEVDAASNGGVGVIRDIKSRMGMAPISGKARMWLLDEAHKLTSEAQGAMLKMLEDTPGHVYFILATTDPQKLLPTIKTRATTIVCKSLSDKDLEVVLQEVAAKEKKTFSEEVIGRIVEQSSGSARQALVLLNACMALDSVDDQLKAIKDADLEAQAIDVARKLLNPKVRWNEITPILKNLVGEPETTRRVVLSYMTSVMLGGGPLTQRAFQIADVFQHNFYDTGKSGLILACYASTNI